MSELAASSPAPGVPPGIAAQVERLATHNCPIVITGPIGVGKTHLARLIHERSKRPGAFVSVPLTSLQQGFEHVTLAGHDKGSYTGADRKRGGLLQEAHGGTLLLDEIGDASVEGQRILLELLSEQGLRRLGEERRVRYDLRFILATNVNLDEATAQGRFREDLLSRLGHCWISLPALRERPEEIPALIAHYLGRFAAESGRCPPTLAAELRTTLQLAPWIYNVRSLVNECQVLATWSPDDGVLGIEHLSERFWREVRRHLDQLPEGERAKYALQVTGDDRARAIALAGLTQRTFYRHAAQGLPLRKRGQPRSSDVGAPEFKELPSAES